MIGKKRFRTAFVRNTVQLLCCCVIKEGRVSSEEQMKLFRVWIHVCAMLRYNRGGLNSEDYICHLNLGNTKDVNIIYPVLIIS